MYMKKLFITANLILFLAALPSVAAADDWDTVFDGYNEAQYGKTISEKEYQDAVKTMEKFQKKDKTKKNKGGENITEEKASELKFEAPSSLDLLLTLTTDVHYNGRPIERGFYLASAINRDNRHFIRLSLGEGRVIAEIEANALESTNEEKKIFSEIVDNGILKLTYTDYDVILEAYLWIK